MTTAKPAVNWQARCTACHWTSPVTTDPELLPAQCERCAKGDER